MCNTIPGNSWYHVNFKKKLKACDSVCLSGKNVYLGHGFEIIVKLSFFFKSIKGI